MENNWVEDFIEIKTKELLSKLKNDQNANLDEITNDILAFCKGVIPTKYCIIGENGETIQDLIDSNK